MKKRISKVGIVLVCVLIPLGTLGFGYFVGYKSSDKQVAETLTVDGNLGGSVVETQETNTDGIVPGDTVAETINVTPNATAPSLLRVKIEPIWYEGNEISKLSTENIKFLYATNVKEAFTTGNGDDYWYKYNDYLYYMNSVTTKENAMELVNGIKFLGGTNDTNAQDYQGKKLKITVTMDMIQCKYAPFKTRWGVPESNQLYSKLKALCSNSDDIVE